MKLSDCCNAPVESYLDEDLVTMQVQHTCTACGHAATVHEV